MKTRPANLLIKKRREPANSYGRNHQNIKKVFPFYLLIPLKNAVIPRKGVSFRTRLANLFFTLILNQSTAAQMFIIHSM